MEARVFEALEDGYYEVRAQAARTMGCFSSELIQKQAVTEKLLTLIKSMEKSGQKNLTVKILFQILFMRLAILNIQKEIFL